MSTDEKVSLEGFNPFDDAVQQCPHVYYHAMRQTAPVFKVEGMPMFMVTAHELITPILRDTTTFSNAFGSPSSAVAGVSGEAAQTIKDIMSDGWPGVSTLLTEDPPMHTKYRSTVAPYFTPKRIAELRPDIEAVVDTLIVDLVSREGTVFDFQTAFSVPLPVGAIARVLNVPTSRMADFKRWSDDSVIGIGSMPSTERRIEAARGVVEFQKYFAEQIEQRRETPSSDLLSDLAMATIEDLTGETRQLTMPEMLSIVQQLLVAGNETTTKALTEGVLLLAQHPREWERLREDPSGYAPLVTEEVLRLSTPTQGMFRRVTRDTEVAGVAIPKNSQVVLVYAAANRDPLVWGDNADEFDPQRPNHKEHVAFGKGIHFCIGAPLSRLELNIAFERLARRIDRFVLADSNDYRYQPSFVLRGLERLDVMVEPAT